MSKLGDILQEEILGEVHGILAEAESRAAKLVGDAEEERWARLKSHQKKIEAEARATTLRARSAGELTLSTARMQAKGEVIESVRKKALAALEELSKKPEYRDILGALAEEALKAVEEAEAAVVHPDDEEMMREWAVQKGLELRTDPGLHLGVSIVDQSGKRSVENSLGERLARGWSALASDVAKQLWG
ncbi:MAG: V-type ATP synthase subunit E [Deltaproteobacteria bacterium]|jgi:V/A-type H+-transporting ATPase subunit E